MSWSELTQNWAMWFARLKTRFPNLEDDSMPFLKTDRERFEAYVAEKHDLTLVEAREEVNDFLFVEQLAREAFDYRSQANG